MKIHSITLKESIVLRYLHWYVVTIKQSQKYEGKPLIISGEKESKHCNRLKHKAALEEKKTKLGLR